MIRISYEEIKEAVDSTITSSQAAAKLGIQYATFMRKAKKYGLFKPNRGGKGLSKPTPLHLVIPLDEILDGKHPTYQTFKLKRRLYNEGIMSNVCSECGIFEWNSKPIQCELDHINGDSHDHRLSNLRILCPNCHSQTDTFRSKNRSKNKRTHE